MTFDSLKVSYKTFTRLLYVSNDSECIKNIKGLYVFTYALTDYLLNQGDTSILKSHDIIKNYERIDVEDLANNADRRNAIISICLNFPCVLDSIRGIETLFNKLSELVLLIFNIITNRTYPVKTILLSYIGWESIGNSNWYMFAIFSLYIFIYISFRFFKKMESVIPLIIFTLLASCFIDVLYFFELDIWWYNTILCFVSGMWYSRYKKEIDCVVQKNDIAYCRTLLCSIFIFAVLYYGHLKYSPQIMIFTAPIFALIIIFLSMKVKFRSKLLSFLGDHVFSIYILQRLAFLILKDKTTNQYLYFLSSLLLTIIISLLFDKVFNTIERSLRKRNIYRE